MDLTHTIASRLNLRAVDLDEKTSAELLEILINVIDNITRNARQCINNKEITDESVKGVMRNHIVRTDAATNLSRANVISNVVSFLQTHKCDLLPSASWDDWVVALEAGEKEVIYSLLHWVLINSRELTNRCYLAPFLIPVEVPEVLLNDDNLYDLVESYKELQHDFVEIHKAFESLKESKALTIPELSAEIDRVDLEKKQLLDILQRDKSSNQKFQELLAETSLMRESEELTLRLEQQKIDQMAHSEAAKKRVKDAWRLLEAMKRNATSVDHCIAELEKKSQKAVLHLESQLIPQRLKLEAMIAKAEKDASTVRMGGDEEENSVYKTENARLRIALDEIIETSGINMSEDDFQELQSSLQEKLRLYQSESEKLSIAQQQLLALEGNKKELTERLQVVEKILQQQEEKGEITGFREVHRQLGHTFQETCVLNEVKCATLDEMSAIVSNIAVTLDGKRDTLEPKIAKLKEERAALQQTREEYNIKKSRYDELQRTLTGENKSLEGRFSQMQKECEELESLYKLLMTTETSTLEQKAEEATQDEPSFRADSNLSQLYEDKICELQQLRTELSKEHQDYETKEGHDYILKQVAMFNSLKELLEMKQHCLLMGANTK